MVNIFKKLESLVTEIKDAHKRITFVTERIMQIENYLGLRKHEFSNAKYQQKYVYNQIKKDIKENKEPETIHPYVSNKRS